jgi:lysozyme family protein
MIQNYKQFIDRMINKYEGGFGWDRADAGGPTKYGITCYDLAEHMGKKMGSMSAWAPIVRAMSLDVAEAIYLKKYASRDRFADLESGTDCVIIDYGVNSGIARPVWTAQQLLGRPRSTTFSDDLVKAINDQDAARFIDRMCDARMAYLRQLGNWPTFRGGWTARVADLRAYCHHIAIGWDPMPIPVPIPDHMESVRTAQRAYNSLYHLIPPLDVDGYEGPKTKEATKRFQSENALNVDGLIGPNTLSKIAELPPAAPGPLGLVSLDDEPGTDVMARGIETAADLTIK